MFSDITPAKIGFIGLGLIGGSVAKAIRTYFPDYELIAFDKNKETLALAVQENIIDTSCSAIDDNFKGCSYIFLCAPVSYNTACLTQLKSLIDPEQEVSMMFSWTARARVSLFLSNAISS